MIDIIAVFERPDIIQRMSRIYTQPTICAALVFCAAYIPFPAFAYGGIGEILPLSAAFPWITIFPILLETVVFRWWFGLSWMVAIPTVLAANLMSSFVGFFIGLTLSERLESFGIQKTFLGADEFSFIIFFVGSLIGFVLVSAAINTAVETPILKGLTKINDVTGRVLWTVFMVNLLSSALMLLLVIGHNSIRDTISTSQKAYLQEHLVKKYHDEFVLLDNIFGDLSNKYLANGLDANLISEWAEQALHLDFRELKIVVWHHSEEGAYIPVEEVIIIQNQLHLIEGSSWFLGAENYFGFDYSIGRVICCRRIVQLSRGGVFGNRSVGQRYPFNLKAVLDWP